MNKHYRATVRDKQVLCPTCGHNRFFAHKHYIAKGWMQFLDVEVLGKEGFVLICQYCTRVQQFAQRNVLTLEDEQSA